MRVKPHLTLAQPWRQALPLALILLGAFALRLYRLDWQSLWLDEVDVLRLARQELPILVKDFGRMGQNGPAHYLLMHLWLDAAGDSEFALRYYSLAFGVVAVPLLYQLGRQLLSPGAALVGSLLLALSPYHLWYSQDGKMYTLVAVLALAASLVFLAALRGGRPWLWPLYLALVSMGFYTHLFLLLLPLVHLGWLLVLAQGKPQRLWPSLLLSPLLLVAAWPLLSWLLPVVSTALPSLYPSLALTTILEVLFLRFTYNREALPWVWVLAPFLGFLALALFQPRQAVRSTGAPELSERQGLLLLLLYLFVPLGLYYGLSLRFPAFMHRYFMAYFPAYLLLLALGHQSLWRFSPRLATAGLGALLLISAAFLLVPDPLKADFRSAAALYRQEAGPEDGIAFIAGYSKRVFAYYTPQFRGVWLPSLNYPGAASALDGELPAWLAGYRTLWLLEHEPWFWDGQGHYRTWFDGRQPLLARYSFHGVTLSRYLLPSPASSPAE